MFYEFKVPKKKILKKRNFLNYISKIKSLFLDYNSRKESGLEKIKNLLWEVLPSPSVAPGKFRGTF